MRNILNFFVLIIMSGQVHAVTPSGSEVDLFQLTSCEAIVSGRSLLSLVTPMPGEFESLVKSYRGLRAAVTWGQQASPLVFDAKATHRVLPFVPLPDEISDFQVSLVGRPAKSSSKTEQSAHKYQVAKVILGGHDLYILKTQALGRDPIQILNFFVALAAVPYVTYLIVSDEFHATPFVPAERAAFEEILRRKKKVATDAVAVSGFEPGIVQFLTNQRGPFVLRKTRLIYCKGIQEVADLARAEDFYVDYTFSVRSPLLEQSASCTLH